MSAARMLIGGGRRKPPAVRSCFGVARGGGLGGVYLSLVGIRVAAAVGSFLRSHGIGGLAVAVRAFVANWRVRLPGPRLAFSPALIWLTAAVSSLGMTACGVSSQSSTRRPASLATAVTETQAARTGELTEVVSASQGGDSLKLTSDKYVFDRPHGLLEATADLRAVARLQPQGLQGANPADFVFTLVVDRRHGPTFYMSSPLFATRALQSQLPAASQHRAWMKLDVGTLQSGAIAGLGPGQSIATALSQTTSPLVVLSAISTSHPSLDGHDLIAGEPTTRYATTADLTHGAIDRLVAKIAQASKPRWAAKVWVDGNAIVRRVQLTSPPIASQGNATYQVTYQTRALGIAPHIEVPAANDVFQLPH